MAENSSPKIFGLIGYPVKHSFSPAMHNAAFRALKINAEYRLFEVKPEELEDFLLKPDKVFKDINGKSIRAGDVAGFNITIPHKVRAREILEKARTLSFEYDTQESFVVRISGAINTIKRGSSIPARNTDAPGFLLSLQEDLNFTLSNKNVLVVGCGGAGRAVIAGLSWKEYGINKIFVNDITNQAIESAKKHFSQFQEVMNKIEFISRERIPDVIKSCQLLVNASPVGMEESDASVIDKDLLRDGLSVYDVVYNRETQLIRDAKSKGLAAKGGEGMLLYQGALAFEIWTDKRASIDVMRQTLQEELKKCRK